QHPCLMPGTLARTAPLEKPASGGVGGGMDFLSVSTSFAGELIQRTSSTARVQEMVQLSLTPAFLLAAIGAFLNVMNQRLTWIVDRVHALERLKESDMDSREVEGLPVLRRRR